MSASCPDEVCVTCADYAVPAVVVRLGADALALVTTGDEVQEVSVALVDVRVGDVVLVHAAEAIAVVRGGRAEVADDHR